MNQTKTLTNDLTAGSIPKKLLLFALPFMASNALQVLYSLVDMVIVGRFVGSYGLSAVSIASQIIMFCTALCLGFSTGGQILIAQLVGAKRQEQLNNTIGTLFSTVLMLGFFFSLLVLGLRTTVLRLIHTPKESFGMASVYLAICGGGIVFTFCYNMFSAVLRGMGDSRHPFLFITIASVTNLALDFLFTGLLQWGVLGAALATIISQAVSCLFALNLLYRRRIEFGFDFKRKSFRIHRSILKTLASLGIPIAISSCSINISMIFVNSLVNQVGVYASAAFGTGIKLDDIVTKLTQGVMYAVAPMVGQNMAAGKQERAQKVVCWALLFCGCMYAVFTMVYIRYCREMFGIFTEDIHVIDLAPVFVSAIIWNFPAMVIMRAVGGFIQGIGHAKLVMILGILDGFVFRILLSYGLGIVMGMGLYGFILGYGLASYANVIPASIYYLSGRWKKRKLLIRD